MSSHEQVGGNGLREWERAEIERSGIEATLTSAEELVADEANVARYMAPSDTTPYPLEYAFHLLGDVRGKTVIDLGCGSGINSLLLARRGARVIGVDISESLLRMALKRATVNHVEASTRFIASSAHDLSLMDESADVVLGIAILHHLDLRLIADETWRLIKKGGRAIFQEPIRNSRLLRVLRRAIPYRAPDVSPFERPLLDEEIAAFASRFSRSRSRVFCLPFVSVANVIGVSRPHLHRLYQYDARLLRKMPRLEKYSTIRVIEVIK
jgi:ubiquinone/menaquinone biosynthesis C-methylase UbiE